MAQATISGTIGFSYIQETGSKAGLANTDGNITVRATEDLGGGLRATASMAFQNLGRGNNAGAAAFSTVGGRDVSITVAGGFGSVLVGEVESASPLNNVAGGVIRGLNSDALSIGDSNVSVARYFSPAINGFTFNAGMLDLAGANAVVKTSRGAANIIGLTYAAGPLNAAADMTQYPAATNAAQKSRTRLTARYNFGVATVGVGYQTFSARAGAAQPKTTSLGVTVPMGALSFSAQQTTEKTGAVTDKGTAYGINYALSKRTAVALLSTSIKEGSAAATTSTRLRLLHTF
jgi:hypothetical protein